MDTNVNWQEMYGNLTPKHRKEFQAELCKYYNWRTRQAFYKFLRGKKRITRGDEQYILSMFNEFYKRQIATLSSQM